MRRALVLVAVSIAAATCWAAPPPETAPALPPLAAFDPVQGVPVPLDPAQGPMHIVVLATWCRPCLEEVPKLFDLEDRFKPEGYRLFLVALKTRQSVDRLRAFMNEGPLPGRLLFDQDGSVSAALGVAAIPAHILIDRKGRIVARTSALDPAFFATVERLVRQEGRVAP